MLTINSEHLSSEYHFESKYQDKNSPYDKSVEKKEEELIDFKEEHHDTLRKSSSGPIQNEVLTITSEHPSSEDKIEGIFQANISPSDQSFEK